MSTAAFATIAMQGVSPRAKWLARFALRIGRETRPAARSVLADRDSRRTSCVPRARSAVPAVFLALLPCGASADARASDSLDASVAPGPIDMGVGPWLALEVRVGMTGPLLTEGACPPPAPCVLGGGGTLGATVDRQGGDGWSLGITYEAAFLDSQGVYELGLAQRLLFRVRRLAWPHLRSHPWVGAAAGPMFLGDGFTVATVGGVLRAMGGVDVEISEAMMVSVALWSEALSLAPFSTSADRTARARTLHLDVVAGLDVGISIVTSP
ncbi:MAG: hypothetical protein RMK74_04790 [Myxococcales bacterium]|nr:hypothetical protein [Myxococcales bacterium]